jgi:hypothetical protein
MTSTATTAAPESRQGSRLGLSQYLGYAGAGQVVDKTTRWGRFRVRSGLQPGQLSSAARLHSGPSRISA